MFSKKRRSAGSSIAVIFMIFILMLCMATQIIAANETGTCGDGVSWSFDSQTGTLDISGNGEITDAPWSSFSGEIKKITVGDGITGICESAFSNCTQLTSVTLGKDLEYIGLNAFKKCDAFLEYIDGVAYAGQYALAFDKQATALIIREGTVLIADQSSINVIKEKKWESVSLPSSLKYIGKSAFSCSNFLMEITIPDSVVRIGNGAFSGSEFETINIPENVTYIGELAFHNSQRLKSVTIPDNVTFIGENVFDGCTSLESVTLGKGITEIPRFAFQDCTSLKSFNVGDGITKIGTDAFLNCSSLETLTIGKDLVSLSPSSFRGCSSLAYVSVKEGNEKYYSRDNSVITKEGTLLLGTSNSIIPLDGSITNISGHSFHSRKITSITIPNTVTSLTAQAISYCDDLENIYIQEGNPSYKVENNCVIDNAGRVVMGCKTSVIPNGVTEILSDAFYGCTGLTEITIPSSVTNIGSNAFEYCTSLKRLIMPEGDDAQLNFSDLSFSSTAIEELVFDRPIFIMDQTFGINASLKTVVFNDTVDFFSINEAMFGIRITPFTHDPNIVTVSFTDMDMLLERMVWFDDPQNIQIKEATIVDLVLPEGITQTPSFNGSNIKSLTIPSTLQKIDRGDFRDCHYLEKIYYNATECTIDENSFEGCGVLGSGCEVIVGENVKNIPDYFVSPYYGEDKSRSNIVKVSLPEGLESIGAKAFEYCRSLKEINIPSTVTTIGESAFIYTDIEKITIPDSVTNIGDGIFQSCYSLTECVLPNNWKKIPGAMFFACTALSEFTLPTSCEELGYASFSSCRNLKKITFPEGLKHIGESSFILCTSLKEIVFPETLVSIGAYAFSQSTLVSITIPKNVETIAETAFKSSVNFSNAVIYSPAIISQLTSGTCTAFSLAEAIVIPSELASESDAFHGFDTVEDCVVGTRNFKVHSNHSHVWANGTALPSPTETCHKRWTCSTCIIQCDKVVHIPGAAASCVIDQLCTVCKKVLVGKIGHDLVHHNGKSPTCTLAGYSDYDTCTRCTYTSYKDLGALGHAIVNHGAKEVSCTDIGWNDYVTCDRCEYSTYSEIGALGHDMQDEFGQSPTCTQDGWLPYRYCTRCDLNDKVVQMATGHTLLHYDGKSASCTEIGWDAYDECASSSCDYTTYKEIAAFGHDYVYHESKPVSCTENGWNEYHTCTRCTYSDIEMIYSFGHDLAFFDYKPETCTEYGWYSYEVCSKCDHNTYVEIAAHGHAFYHVDAVEPSCVSIGWDAYDTCSYCGLTTYNELAALGHDIVHYDTKEPTCVESGYTAHDVCLRCSYFSPYEVINPYGHDLVYHDHKMPTCTETGWESYETCTRCPHTTYRELGRSEHHLIDVGAQEPTCENIGWNAYQYCFDCTLTTYVELAPLGHSLTDHEQKLPTCTEDGWKAYTACTACEYTTFEVIYSTGHLLTHHDAKAPTCTEIGWEGYETCANCSYTTYVPIPTTEHTLKHNKGKDPTCTENGHHEYSYCSSCSYTTYAVIPMLGHDYVHHEGKKPTCIETGWKEYSRCSRCSEYDTKYVELPVTKHTFPENAEYDQNNHWYTCTNPMCNLVDRKEAHSFEKHIIKEPTTTEKGENRYICACGYEFTEITESLPVTEEVTENPEQPKDDLTEEETAEIPEDSEASSNMPYLSYPLSSDDYLSYPIDEGGCKGTLSAVPCALLLIAAVFGTAYTKRKRS